MSGKLTGWDDTIIALATPPGIGAIGVIRLSGNKSFEIVNRIFLSKDLSKQASHTLHVGFIHHREALIDEVVVGLYRGPKSYTGEDVVEISGHGSPFVLEQIVKACVDEGARPARAGEFSQRAFLNGKLDLAQAEAVADLIASHSEAASRSALHTMRGGFSNDLKALRDGLLTFSSLIELELDFSQEDVEFADRQQFELLIQKLQSATNELLQSFKLGNVIKNGVQVVIAGKPNAGKSTLLNALLNENRAIVSEIAGTTRDTVEEILNIEGILFMLIDTAGIRDHSADTIEMMGVARSREKIAQADIVLYLFDAATTQPEELDALLAEFQNQPAQLILVANKIDTIGETAARTRFASVSSVSSVQSTSSVSSVPSVSSVIPSVIFVSAKQERYIDSLQHKLVETVLHGAAQPEGTVVTNARHFHALQQVASSLSDIRRGLDEKLTGDLLSLDIRRCLHWLGEITGEVTNEEQLDWIFSKFCIGK